MIFVYQMLESKSTDSLNADADAAVRYPRSQLIRLVLDLSLKCQQVPSALFLKGVKRTDTETRAAGGFADIYRGTWSSQDIAIKCLRIFILSPESQKARLRQVSNLEISVSLSSIQVVYRRLSIGSPYCGTIYNIDMCSRSTVLLLMSFHIHSAWYYLGWNVVTSDSICIV